MQLRSGVYLAAENDDTPKASLLAVLLRDLGDGRGKTEEVDAVGCYTGRRIIRGVHGRIRTVKPGLAIAWPIVSL